MQIIYQPAAANTLAKIGSVAAQRIRHKMRDYAADPAAFVNMVKRLKGDRRLRLRIGDYRVLFTEDGIVLVIEEVGHRSKVYRRII